MEGVDIPQILHRARKNKIRIDQLTIIKSLSANYTISVDDKFNTYLVTASTNTITIDLPPAADMVDRQIKIMKIDANVAGGEIIVDGDGAETINGSATYTISNQYGFIEIVSDGTQWIIIGGVDPDKWHYVGTTGEPAFQNSWVNYGSTYEYAKFRKTINNEVQIQGLIKFGLLGNVAFTMPSGYIPSRRVLESTYSNTGITRVDVQSSLDAIPGGVFISSGGQGWLSIEGISFGL